MTTQEKIQKLKKFQNEREFREFLIDFLKKCGFKDVQYTHRYGSPEKGKDIIAKYPHMLEGGDWYAFVVKKGRLAGGTTEIETIKNQIKQAFEYPYLDLDGNKQKVNKVKVVTNENFTGGAQDELSQSPELKIYNNVNYWWNEKLIPLIDEKYPDFWLPGDIFTKEYSKSFSKKLQSEIAIRELSIRKIDDKKVQKLLDIFIEPKLTSNVIEENKKTHEKILKEKCLNIKSIDVIKENLLLSGEQGSGKSRVLNTIACYLASAEKITENRTIPVRIKAPQFREFNFHIENTVISEIKELTDDYYKEEYLGIYKPILFIDDIDLLKKDERKHLISEIKKYCEEKATFYVLTYRKNELDYDKNIKTIEIHNFNSKQINAFVSKFFEGTDRGERFIKILRESDILSKLPTTPLTITLISLLYDENNYEIPATLSDIYTDFTSVLLGKLEIKNKTDLLIFNLKRRLFTAISLKMLDEKNFEISFNDFKLFINNFLEERGYQIQNNDDLNEIIEKSCLLYKDDNELIGFKQQAFVEFFASLEIYHHCRDTHYIKLINQFNDVTWQNTAIFYAGHSKELHGMIDDIVLKAPNNNLKDWFVNTGGMGYLAQALYQTKPIDREKLLLKSLDNLIKAFYEIKKLSADKENLFYDIPLTFVCGFVNFWFNENFKSITLMSTLAQTFDELYALESNFENNFKLLMVSSTLMNPYIGEISFFEKLLDRNEFINHPILPHIANMVIEIGRVDKKNIPAKTKLKIEKSLQKKKDYLKAIIKEPAYRFNDDFSIDN
jgi:energy-coupling factor transporter ATP-binding protein EcfA2